MKPETYDGLDLPGEDDDFDYDEFIAREFGEGPKRGWRGIPKKKLFWGIVAVVTLLAYSPLLKRWPLFARFINGYFVLFYFFYVNWF